MIANQLVRREIIQYYKGGKRRPRFEHRYYQNGQIIEFQMKSCGKKPVRTITLKF